MESTLHHRFKSNMCWIIIAPQQTYNLLKDTEVGIGLANLQENQATVSQAWILHKQMNN